MRAVVAGYFRSPFTPAKRGELAKTRPDDIAAMVVNGLLKNTGVNPSLIEDLIVAATNNAKKNVESKTQEEMSKLTGGLQLPAGFKLPF